MIEKKYKIKWPKPGAVFKTTVLLLVSAGAISAANYFMCHLVESVVLKFAG